MTIKDWVGYKGKNIPSDVERHIGVCNRCRAVIPFDASRTHLHHEQYHDENPFKDTIELCQACHGSAHRSQQKKSVLNIDIDDEVERMFRIKAFETFGYKKGALSLAAEDAFMDWVNAHK